MTRPIYKTIQLDSVLITDPLKQTEACVTLKLGQIMGLTELVQPQRWATRWYNQELDQDVRDSWVDDIVYRLFNNELCAEQPDEPTCITLEPFHPAIQYYVNHPLYQPEYHPLPYTQPSWIRGGGATVGTTENDAVLNPLALFGFADLQAILTAGVPSLTINFRGLGEVDIEFIQQVQGGMVWVFPDGNPLLGQVVDLEFIDVTDLASFEFLLTVIGIASGEQQTTTVHTVTFDTAGDHSITCWFLPKGDLEPPFVGWGGGLRKVQLCGEEMEAIDMPIAYDLTCDTGVLTLLAGGAEVSEIDLVECAQLSHFGAIRVNNCAIEQYNLLTDEWVASAGSGVLPLSAGATCKLTDTLHLAGPSASPGLEFEQSSVNPLKYLWRATTADANAADFRSFLFNSPNTSGADNVVLIPYSYNMLTTSQKQDSAEPGWYHALENNWLVGGQRFTELYWEYRGATRNYRPLMFQINRDTDYGQFLMYAGDLSYLDAATGTQFLKAQLGNIQLFNNTTITIQTNGINAISQKRAGGPETLSLLMLDSADRTVIGRQANGVVLRGNPVTISPSNDANEVFRAALTGGVRSAGFFGATPVVKQTVEGASLASVVDSLLSKLTAYGLITDTSILPEEAPILGLQISGCGLQSTLDGENWDDIPGAQFLPLSSDVGCNVVELADPGYLVIRRLDGSTESANPVLRIQSAGGAGSLPIQVLFEMDTSQQQRTAATIETAWLEPSDGARTSQMSINLMDYAAARSVIKMQAAGQWSEVGFLGAEPVSRRQVNLDQSTENILQSVLQGLVDLGLFVSVPCVPLVGDWAVVWENIQLWDWEAGCGIENPGGMLTETACGGVGTDSQLGINVGWQQQNDSQVVYMEAHFQWSGIEPATGFRVRFNLNPGATGSAVLLDQSYFDASGSAVADWEGDADFDDLGVSVLIQNAAPGSVLVTKVRIEGTGEIPPALGGSECG
jgi:hypothetical protein